MAAKKRKNSKSKNRKKSSRAKKGFSGKGLKLSQEYILKRKKKLDALVSSPSFKSRPKTNAEMKRQRKAAYAKWKRSK